ncbi:hypothetical protein [Haloplanus rubicundus]|uniref:hypothetical protein n=1 Tax=Haloplanus rubicundus TaxID=1547898 RepID=UPI0013002A21|nr:hypothetical protein [Haloplanus rubicundus]
MTRVHEEDVHDALLRYAGEETVEIGDGEVDIEITPVDIHTIDSPDSIIWVKLNLEMFSERFRVKLPLPVEAEAAGLDHAKEDLEKFIQRENYIAELPMLIVAEKGFDSDEESVKQCVSYNLEQIPERLLDE